MTARYAVIVVGAGVAGATAAILLAQAGWSVALVEKRIFPRRKVCGECVAATNLELLDALGIGESFAALAGPPLRRVALVVGHTMAVANLPRARGPAGPWGRALGREQLDTQLLTRAAALGAELWQPWSVQQLVRSGGVHECRLRSPSGELAVIEAPLVIGATGSWERSPWLDDCEPKSPRPSDLLAFKANFRHAGLEPGVLPVLAFPGGYGGMVIADSGHMTLACCIRRDRLRRARGAHAGVPAGAVVQALLEQACNGVRHVLHGAEPVGPWLSTGPLRPGRRPLWREQLGFSIGNAAGEAHPILGEGITMGMQSAWLLCQRLLAHGAPQAAGESQAVLAHLYARDWRENFSPRLRWAAVFAHLAMRSDRLRVLLPVLRRWPSLLTLAARVGGKVRPIRSSGRYSDGRVERVR